MEPEDPQSRGYHVPPCVRLGVPMNPCARARYAEQVLGELDLFDAWKGWKFRGNYLVSPDGLKVNPQRLRGILFREQIKKPVNRGGAEAPRESSKIVELISPCQMRGRL